MPLHHAVSIPEGKVEDESEAQPDHEASPSFKRQEKHQDQVGRDADWGHQKKGGAPEGPLRLGPLDAQDQHRGADDDEREERADVHHFPERPNRREGGDRHDDNAGEDG